jgi:multimeric flavodoxin WrbA
MKVLLVNGNPRENGCISIALKEFSKGLDKYGIGQEVVIADSQYRFGRTTDSGHQAT